MPDHPDQARVAPVTERLSGGPQPRRANNPFVSRWARYYDLIVSLPPMANVRRSEERTLAVLIAQALRPADHVLEIGPGTGRYTVEFARRVTHVTAVEQSAEMLALLQSRLSREGVRNCSAVLGDFCAIKLDGLFDVVALIGVLDYIAEPAEFLARAAQLARRELLFTAPHCGLLARVFRAASRLRGIAVYNYTSCQIRSYLDGFDVQIIETGLHTRLCRGMTLACRAVRR